MYLDCYIIENLLINYIIIKCVAYISRSYTKGYRYVLGAIVGTVYSVFYLYNKDSILFTAVFKFIFILFIVVISFQISSKEQFLKTLLYFYLVNVFISGSVYFTIYFTGTSHIEISFLIICAYISCKLLKVIVNNIKLIKQIDELKKEVSIVISEKIIRCTALLDSGNLLKEPISKADVVVVDYSLIEGFLEKNNATEKINISNTQCLVNALENKFSNRIRIIPYKCVGSEGENMLVGIKADYLEIDDKKISNIVVGISSLDEDGYNAILNPKILC